MRIGIRVSSINAIIFFLAINVLYFMQLNTINAADLSGKSIQAKVLYYNYSCGVQSCRWFGPVPILVFMYISKSGSIFVYRKDEAGVKTEFGKLNDLGVASVKYMMAKDRVVIEYFYKEHNAYIEHNVILESGKECIVRVLDKGFRDDLFVREIYLTTHYCAVKEENAFIEGDLFKKEMFTADELARKPPP
ncbi:MAG TPA: hypothetical protein ENH55_03080 [Aurantimonas coralicida]|uniref:Uncharacterized protein n=1 Tax=Aurantimonas coralicida TaxID=182270 RepID=A0A9C9NEF2_9HYPH|nr:hypothetical protein [Aurantimonas coralicida]HEU00111.1 hypothetical protein [Aurantimonas coralicida]